MIQAQAHVSQLPNGDFELTTYSYLSTTGTNVDSMRGASKIKLDIVNNSTMAMVEDFVREVVKKSLEGPDKGQPMLIESWGEIPSVP